MSWRPSHEWVSGPRLPALATGAPSYAPRKGYAPDRGAARFEACELATCEHCHTLRVIDEGSGEATYLRRASKESDRVSTALPPCVSPPTNMRALGEPEGVSDPVRAVLEVAFPEPPAPPPVAQLGLW